MKVHRQRRQPRQRSRHDPYAKFSLKHKQTAIGFLRQHLPTDLLARLDLEHLRIEGEHMVGRDLGARIADVVISVPFRECEGVFMFIMVEHLRQPEHLTPFRLIAMVFQFLQGWLRHHHGRRNFRQAVALPLVVPMVFYNGKMPYSGPLRLLDLFSEAATFERILCQPIKLIDTHHLVLNLSDGDLYSYVFQVVMKYISSPRLKEILLDLKPDLEKMGREAEGLETIHALIRYLATSAEHMQPEAIRQWVRSMDFGGSNMKALLRFYREEFGSEMDDLVAEIQRLKREGRALKRQADERHALAMLQEGLDLDMIARVLGASRAWVQRLAERQQTC